MHKRRGFTLVELLVVIAIIALLMSILMPALAAVKLRAKSVACMSNLSQWGKIFTMYTDAHDGYFMHGFYTNYKCLDCQRESWPHSLRSYVDIRDKVGLQYCPITGYKDLNKKRPSDMFGSTLYPWGGPDCYDFLGGKVGDTSSYGTNSFIYNRWPDRQGNISTDHWRRSDVPNAGIIPVFADATWVTAGPWHTHVPPEYEGANFRSGATGCQGMGVFCINRHYGAINIVFMDWSVRRIRLKRLWTLKWNRNFDVNGPWTIAGGVTYADWTNEGTGWMAKFPH